MKRGRKYFVREIFGFCKKQLKLDRSKKAEKFMDANIREFGKRSFKASRKIETPKFVTTHKTTGFH